MKTLLVLLIGLLSAPMVSAKEYLCQTTERTWVAGSRNDLELMWALVDAKDQAALMKLIESERLVQVKAGLPISVKGDESRYDTLPIQYGLIRFEGMTEYMWTSMALIDCPTKTPDEATPEPTPPAKKKKAR